MTKLQSKNLKEETVLDDLEFIYAKTRDISKESGIIDFKEDFKITLKDLLLAFQTDEVSVVTKGLNDIQWNSISDLKKTAIYRVIQELMTNMKKHSKASIVVLTFQKSGINFRINYTDNGVGTNLKKYNGLQNAENRIVSLNGTITFESQINKGFKVKITI
jgi:signal transduction histidine kinase